MRLNKFALALCGLAASGAALAQPSSVTIYGVLDLGVAKYNNGTSFLNGLPVGLTGRPDTWNLRPSTSNRIGFRGSEDLGGGLRANFSIEHRLDPSAGTEQSGQNGMWRGHSWVGLSSPTLGELRLGRQQNAALFVAQKGDPWNWDYNVGSVQVINRAGNAATYTANLVSYTTPNFSGLTVKAEMGLGEGGTDPLGNANRTVGANVQYTKGPLYVGLGYNDIRVSNSPAKNRYWVATLNYDFKFIRPILQYTSAKNLSTQSSHSYVIGATMPVSNGRLKAVVGRYDPAGANNTTLKLGLGYEYFLSKRTSVHADVGTGKTDGRTRTTGFEAGLKHIF